MIQQTVTVSPTEYDRLARLRRRSLFERFATSPEYDSLERELVSMTLQGVFFRRTTQLVVTLGWGAPRS